MSIVCLSRAYDGNKEIFDYVKSLCHDSCHNWFNSIVIKRSVKKAVNAPVRTCAVVLLQGVVAQPTLGVVAHTRLAAPRQRVHRQACNTEKKDNSIVQGVSKKRNTFDLKDG